MLIALSWIYMAYGNVPAVAGALYGVKPAVTAIVLHAAWRIGSRALKTPPLWAIAAAAFVAIYCFQVPFPAIVLAAGLLGVGGRQVRTAGNSPRKPRKPRARRRINLRSSTTTRRRLRTRVFAGRG